MSPTIAILAPGMMGAGLAGHTTARVLYPADGRSAASIERANQAGMIPTDMDSILRSSDIILSVVPPAQAFQVASSVAERARHVNTTAIFVECNAIDPESLSKIRHLFDSVIPFVDGCIIGDPPSDTRRPIIYISTLDDSAAGKVLSLNDFGLHFKRLRNADVGAASSLKMAHGGIGKGLVALGALMIIAAAHNSPSTADALLEELLATSPGNLAFITRALKTMPSKAYRWVAEMDAVSDFVNSELSDNSMTAMHRGAADFYRRIASQYEGEDGMDLIALRDWYERATPRLN